MDYPSETEGVKYEVNIMITHLIRSSQRIHPCITILLVSLLHEYTVKSR